MYAPIIARPADARGSAGSPPPKASRDRASPAVSTRAPCAGGCISTQASVRRRRPNLQHKRALVALTRSSTVTGWPAWRRGAHEARGERQGERASAGRPATDMRPQRASPRPRRRASGGSTGGASRGSSIAELAQTHAAPRPCDVNKTQPPNARSQSPRGTHNAAARADRAG